MDFPSSHQGKRVRVLHTVIGSRYHGRNFTLALILEDGLHPTECRDEDGLTPLMLAARLGNYEAVELLIKHRASLRAQDNNGFTALHWAVVEGHEHVVKILLRKKAEIHHAAADDLNPLQRAFSNGSLQHTNLPMVQLLLEHGADANNFWDRSKGLTVLHQAVVENNQELVVLLLGYKAITHARDATGRMPVEHAQDEGMVELLIEHSLSKKYACGRDLICAANFCKVNLIRRLIESGVDLNSRNSLGRTALLCAHEFANAHFDRIDDDDDYASDGDNRTDEEVIEALDLLLEAGANPCVPDDDLLTSSTSIDPSFEEILSLYEKYCKSADEKWPTKLHQAAASGKLDVVENLLNDEFHKSRVNETDDHGFTALHHAVLWRRGNSEDIIQCLIKNDADPNIRDVYRCTPLHYIIAFGSRSLPLIDLILEAGGVLDAKDQNGRRPADIAILHNKYDVYKMLTKHATAGLPTEPRGRPRQR